MVEIELQSEVRPSQHADDVERRGVVAEQVARHVDRSVDRFEQHRDASGRGAVRRRRDVGDEGRQLAFARARFVAHTCHDVQQPAAGVRRIVQRPIDAVEELRVATGQPGEAAFAARRVARRRVEQHELQA
jgi:hypothetical protein